MGQAGLSGALGDLVDTQDSAAAAARMLGAEIGNIKETISSALLPAMSVGVTGLNSFIKGLEIMGAEAAVSVAKVELAFAKLEEDGGLGSRLVESVMANVPGLSGARVVLDLLGVDVDKSVAEAEANVALITAAADRVKLDIVGLREELEGGGGGGGGGGAAAAVVSLGTEITAVNPKLLELSGEANKLATHVRILAEGGEQAAAVFGRINPLTWSDRPAFRERVTFDDRVQPSDDGCGRRHGVHADAPGGARGHARHARC